MIEFLYNIIMNAKAEAQKILELLPENSDFEDIIRALYIKAKVEAGIKSIENGKGLTTIEVRKRLSKWLK